MSSRDKQAKGADQKGLDRDHTLCEVRAHMRRGINAKLRFIRASAYGRRLDCRGHRNQQADRGIESVLYHDHGGDHYRRDTNIVVAWVIVRRIATRLRWLVSGNRAVV